MIRKIPEFSKAGLLQSSLLIEKKTVRSTLNIFTENYVKTARIWTSDTVFSKIGWKVYTFGRHEGLISRNSSFLPVEIPSYAKFVSPTHNMKFMLRVSKMTHSLWVIEKNWSFIEKCKLRPWNFKASNKVQWNFLKSKYSERVYLKQDGKAQTEKSQEILKKNKCFNILKIRLSNFSFKFFGQKSFGRIVYIELMKK